MSIVIRKTRVNGARFWYAECSRHRGKNRLLTGFAEIGTHNGVRMQAAEHARQHARADARKAAKR